MEGIYLYVWDGFSHLLDLWERYMAFGKEGAMGLVAWLPLIPILILTLSLAPHLQRVIAGVTTLAVVEGLFWPWLAKILPVGEGLMLFIHIGVLLLFAIMVGKVPRMGYPFGIGYLLMFSFSMMYGGVLPAFCVGASVALLLLVDGKEVYHHITALLSARLLVYLSLESDTPLRLPIALSDGWAKILPWALTILLAVVGIHIQRDITRKKGRI